MLESLLTADWFASAASLVVALGCGLLVGMEREQDAHARERRRFGGVRTFALIALLGASGGLLVPQAGWGPSLVLLALVGFGLLGSALLAIWRETRHGLTTEFAGISVFLTGLLAAAPVPGLPDQQRWLAAAALAVVVMGLLSLRGPLHRFADSLSEEDIYATGKLGALLLLVLPVLPREPVARLPVVVPFEVGLLVALIAGIGFIGYVAVRVLGAGRGLVLTGTVGGLVSSTAVALDFSGRVRDTPALAPAAALGIAVACTLMFPRQLAEVAVVSPGLLPEVAGPLLACAVVSAGLVALFFIRHGDPDASGADMVVRNPFSITEALKFAALFVLVLVISEQAQTRLGEGGVYLSALLAGTTDVDAITLSIAQLHQGGLAPQTAAAGLLLAAGANTLTKCGLVLGIGGWQLGYRVLGILLPALLAGGAVLLLQSWGA